MFKSNLSTAEQTFIATLKSMLGSSQWCLYLAGEQNIEKFGGLLPALVLRDLPGAQALAIPLGQEGVLTLGLEEDKAFSRIDAMNEALGLDADSVVSICESAGLNVQFPEIGCLDTPALASQL